MEEVKRLKTLESVKAFSDPYRLQILSVFRKFNRPATVKEVSDQLKETPAKVHYHVKKLERVGILVLVYTKEINGIIAKYYEPTAERFVIKHSEYDKELSKVISNESQRVIANLYESSQRIVIDDLASRDESDETKRPVQFVLSHELYLNEEEAKELSAYIHRLTKSRPAE